jgi:aminopeptidase
VPTDFASKLSAFAEVIVRVGLNLQPDQRLLIAEPYELQGVCREATALVDAVTNRAQAAGARETEVIWGDEAQLRRFAEEDDIRGFESLVAGHSSRISRAVERGDALLFLESSQPELLAGVPVSTAAELRMVAWKHYGPIAQRLSRGATNWTVAPAPASAWADSVYGDRSAPTRLAALWADVMVACRIGGDDPLADWSSHLASLRNHADELNHRRLTGLRMRGPGSDLTLTLPNGHAWCTAGLVTLSGLPFAANLPTEEVFTLPHLASAEGQVRVARPIAPGGSIIDGIELEFRAGRVVRATARTGAGLLRRLLETDEGALRLGEVAWVPNVTSIARTGRFFRHTLLDENALSHVALGAAYLFTLREGLVQSPRQLTARGFNQSLLHIDLPLDVREIVWSG